MHSASHSRGLWFVAAFKIIKGLALLALGIGALKLLHHDVAEMLTHWIDLFRVDPDNQHIHKLFSRIAGLNDRRLKELSAGTFFYSALLLTEGVGLAFRQRWAEYFTIFTTTSLVPLEVYELTKRVSAAKIAVLLINIAVVIYLLVDLRRHKERQ